MKKITALVLCLVMICSCGFVQAFADETVEAETATEAESETATIIISEAPLCLGYADNGAIIEVLDNSGDYVKVKTADGVEGYADARWLIFFPASCKAQVRTERAEIFAEMLKQGDTVEVIERGDEFARVKANDVEGEIETRFLRFADEEEYQSVTVYTAPGALVYDNPWLRDANGKIEFDSLMIAHGYSTAAWVKKNTELTVLADLGDCYYVKGDSVEGYIAKDLALDSEVDYSLVPNPYVIEASETDEDEKGPEGGGETDPSDGRVEPSDPVTPAGGQSDSKAGEIEKNKEQELIDNGTMEGKN